MKNSAIDTVDKPVVDDTTEECLQKYYIYQNRLRKNAMCGTDSNMLEDEEDSVLIGIKALIDVDKLELSNTSINLDYDNNDDNTSMISIDSIESIKEPKESPKKLKFGSTEFKILNNDNDVHKNIHLPSLELKCDNSSDKNDSDKNDSDKK